MKRLFIIATMLVACSAANAQTKIVADKKGNYIAMPADTTKTGKTFTDLDKRVYPVFANSKGREYVIRVSKSGKAYRKYLRID